MCKWAFAFFIFLLFIFGLGTSCMAQSKEVFCGKKWYAEYTKDSDGNIHVPEQGTENDYMQFLCDSSFVLLEDSITLKGRWSFDQETAIITLTQSQIPSLPPTFAYHFMEFDDTHLVMIGEDGTHGQATAYFLAR